MLPITISRDLPHIPVVRVESKKNWVQRIGTRGATAWSAAREELFSWLIEELLLLRFL